MPYAERTTVTVEKSRSEIERVLKRYGAEEFAYGYDSRRAAVQFRAFGRQVRFVLPMPNEGDVMTTPSGRSRTRAQLQAAVEQEARRRWRALALTIKAKLEAVESGIVVFDEEFMAHIVLPSGETMAERYVPQIERAYSERRMPSALPAIAGPE